MRSVGIDVGGTFTDLVAVGEDGTLESRKVLSTPADQSEGVESALRALAAPDVARIVHGTTVATNALLERRGARVALLATAGFTDLLELRRQDRASLYDLAAQHPAPVVAPDDRVPVAERIARDAVLRPLTPDAADEAARAVVARGAEIVAVALLHAHADPAHEQLLESAVRAQAPELDVVRSSAVFPEIREYERTATTVAEAYLRPTVSRYLRRLEERLAALSLPAPGVMTSSGGLRSAAEAARSAASLALSGPAGGVAGAAAVLRAAGIRDALTIDIGGTSADVGLILDGEPLVEAGGTIAGVPIALPRVLVETVSAGGGSIVWVDDGGAVRVGPRSAGARPGPASFGRGATEPALTDAHVVLGHIAERQLSGGVTIDAARAHDAMRVVADRLGVSVERLAHAAIATADATMARALRRVSVQRGIDPRRCTLVAFGGGGPLHACGLAEQVGLTTVLVPPFAGVLSALGLAIAAERRESMASVLRCTSELDASTLAALLASLVQRAGDAKGATPRWWLHARFAGQGHELDLPVEPGDAPAALAERFARLHEARFGFTLEREVELVSARCAVVGAPWPARFVATSPERTVHGPATVQLPDATLLVRPGWTARALPIGGWLLEADA